MSFVLKINNEDMADLGLGVQSIGGWLDQPTTGRATEQAPGWLSGQIPSSIVTLDSRTIAIRFITKDLSFATRASTVDSLQDRWQGRLELELGDQTDRVCVAYLESKPVELEVPINWYDPEPNIVIQCEFTAYQPLFRDKVAQVIGFDSTAREVPMGTGPHEGIIEIAGAATTPVITIKDFRGLTVHTMTFSGSLASDEAWIVDLYERTVTKSDSGVEASADGAFSAATTTNTFPLFMPEWASRVAGSNPTISISSGEGTFTYYRGWRT